MVTRISRACFSPHLGDTPQTQVLLFQYKVKDQIYLPKASIKWWLQSPEPVLVLTWEILLRHHAATSLAAGEGWMSTDTTGSTIPPAAVGSDTRGAAEVPRDCTVAPSWCSPQTRGCWESRPWLPPESDEEPASAEPSVTERRKDWLVGLTRNSQDIKHCYN